MDVGATSEPSDVAQQQECMCATINCRAPTLVSDGSSVQSSPPSTSGSASVASSRSWRTGRAVCEAGDAAASSAPKPASRKWIHLRSWAALRAVRKPPVETRPGVAAPPPGTSPAGGERSCRSTDETSVGLGLRELSSRRPPIGRAPTRRFPSPQPVAAAAAPPPGAWNRRCSWLCRRLGEGLREWLTSMRDPVLYTVRTDRQLVERAALDETRAVSSMDSVSARLSRCGSSGLTSHRISAGEMATDPYEAQSLELSGACSWPQHSLASSSQSTRDRVDVGEEGGGEQDEDTDNLAGILGVATAWVSMLEATSAAIEHSTPLARLAYEAFCSQSDTLVWLAMLINHSINADVLSLVFPLSMFCYGLLEVQPSRRFFTYLTGYTLAVLFAKLFYNLPIFCGTPPFTLVSSEPSTDDGRHIAVCVAPVRELEDFRDSLPTRIDRRIGLRKYSGHSSLPHNIGFWLGALPDMVVFLALLLHREMMCAKGIGLEEPGAHEAADALSTRIGTSKARGVGSTACTGQAGGARPTEAISCRSGKVGEHDAAAGDDASGAEDEDCSAQSVLCAQLVADRAQVAWATGRDAWLGFWHRLLPPTPKPGVDLYIRSGVYALLIMVYSVVYFGLIGRTDVYGSSSQLDPSLFIGVLMGTLVLLADRLIYKMWRPHQTYAALDLVPEEESAAVPAAGPGPTRRRRDRYRSLVPLNEEMAWTAESGHGPGEGVVPDTMRTRANRRPLAVLGVRSTTNGRGSEAPATHARLNGTQLTDKLSPALKLAMHLVLVAISHATIFFAVPLWTCDASNGRCADGSAGCCEASVGVSFFYLLTARYLCLSARQLREGLPLILRDRPMTDGGGGNATATWLQLLVYKWALNVPFLWEVQHVMDWTIEDTSLDLQSYMNIEDIYIGTMLVRTNLYWRRYLKGRRQPWHNKLTQGCCFVSALLLVLVGPLYLFSSVNPIADPNPIRRSHVAYRLTVSPAVGTTVLDDASPRTANHSSARYHATQGGGTFELGTVSRYALADAPAAVRDTVFNLFQCRAATLRGDRARVYKSCGYAYLLTGFSADYQMVKFSAEADSVWSVSPQVLARLRAAVANVPNASQSSATPLVPAPQPPPPLACAALPVAPTPAHPVQIEIEVSFRRTLSLDGPGSDAISIACARALSSAERLALVAHLDGNLPALLLDGVFPKFVRLPSVRQAEAEALQGAAYPWHTLQNLSIALRGAGLAAPPGSAQWWEVNQRAHDASPFQTAPVDGLQVVAAAERLAGGRAASSFTGGGACRPASRCPAHDPNWLTSSHRVAISQA